MSAITPCSKSSSSTAAIAILEPLVAKDCPFCRLSEADIVWSSDRVVAIHDRDPVTQGHTLVIPRRHVATYFDATTEEQAEIWRAVEGVKGQLDESLAPDGYNVGFNAGVAAGQTVMHLHVHVIPRRDGDTDDPRGGVRGVIPGKQAYGSFAPRIVVGGTEDPLLTELAPALDDATQVDLALAFIFDRGVGLLKDRLVDILRRGGQIRIVTGRYQDVTEPVALRHLRSLPLLASREPDALGLRVYGPHSPRGSFHPKAWMVRGNESSAWVGSSNLSQTALETGVEWNYRLVAPQDVHNVRRAFEALWEEATEIDDAWINAYDKARRVPTRDGALVPVAVAEDAPSERPQPRDGVQREALQQLALTRAQGNTAGMVVLATGLGKTFLSAFDSRDFGRVLFIAHREEILTQALDTYRKVRPDDTPGLFNGKDKEPSADLLFASIQTLSAGDNLEHFASDAFDYIVVDEFHHAAADTYRRVLDHFAPKFLLGLTATPERLDGVNLLALCEGNEVYRAGIPRGIESEQLSPFHYFGIGDEVAYEPLPWRSYTDERLTEIVATEVRAAHCLKELRARTSGPVRALGFCVTQRHADFMRAFFAERGVACASVHAGPTADPRTATLERLASGEVEVVFCVDMFNEGVDVPSVDTVLMLRPTQSSIVWLQQLGRGLRYLPGKTLTVLDFIGNHAAFLRRPEVLLQTLGVEVEAGGDAWVTAEYAAKLPKGVAVDFDLRAQDILSALRDASKRQGTKPQRWYRAYREARGVRASALVAEEAGYRKGLSKKGGGWFGFVRGEGDLGGDEAAALDEHGVFLLALEGESFDKSYQMLVVRALLRHPAFPGNVPKAELADWIVSRAARSPTLTRDLGDAIGVAEVRQRLEEDAFPRLAALGPVFSHDGAHISVPGLCDARAMDAVARMIRELIDLHLERYFAEQNKSAMKLPPMRDDDGAEVNARFDVEEHGGVPHVVFHSRGGADDRNTEYGKGLVLLLQRLRKSGLGVERVELSSTQARLMSLADRTLAVDVSDLSAPDRVAAAVGQAAAKAGRKPGAKGSGNNTKQLRIVLREPTPIGELWRALWDGSHTTLPSPIGQDA